MAGGEYVFVGVERDYAAGVEHYLEIRVSNPEQSGLLTGSLVPTTVSPVMSLGLRIPTTGLDVLA